MDGEKIKRLHETLRKILPGGMVAEWLDKPNPTFDGYSPQRLIDRGEIERVTSTLHQVFEGPDLVVNMPADRLANLVGLHAANRLREALGCFMRADEVDTWLATPIPEYDDETPQSVIDRGDEERVWTTLFDIAYGVI